MITFLFWNLNKQSRSEVVARLALRHKVDVVILAEMGESTATMRAMLTARCQTSFHPLPGVEKEVSILTRLSPSQVEPVQDHNRLRIFRLKVTPLGPILVACAHNPSLLHWDAADTGAQCRQLARVIREEEGREGHQRSLLVGDLNVDPFDVSVVAVDGLHAVPTRRIAERQSRTVQGAEWPFFYNPMWGHFGDRPDRPPGSYYYAKGRPVTRFWHLFDQVLLRPGLLPAFRNETLHILTEDGIQSFLNPRGIPDPASASDHLPILFSLDL